MMKKIYVSEKRVSVEYAYRMLKNGKLLFPATPALTRGRLRERLSETVELMLLGVAVPAIYVSELQDGSWLVLEATDRLWSLFWFLSGKGNLGYMDMYPEFAKMSLEELEGEAPNATSAIFDYKLQFQVIDYLTPRYLQLQVGSHVERWSFSREQGVRNSLYLNDEVVSRLTRLAKQLDKKTYFFSSLDLNRQYAILRIYMYRLVFLNMIGPVWEKQSGLQFLLDQSMELLSNREKELIADGEFEQVTEIILSLRKDRTIADRLAMGRGKEPQIRRLSYLYNLAWLAMDGQISSMRFETLISSQGLWERIEKDDVNYDNIRYHYDMILRGRGNI